MSRIRSLISLLAMAIACPWCPAQEAASPRDGDLFPFVLPWDDSSPGITDVSTLLDKPAGKHGYVRAEADGHLYAGQDRIRFYGVDLAFSGNLPTHEQADKVSARMAKFGINIVRFHIFDMRRFPEGILDRNSTNTRDLDPEGLDRLDYFMAQLAKHGIYTNVCLLNYRPINAADGLPPEIEKAGDSPYQRRHVVGFFDDRVLDLQKEYARKLLGRRNAYTGRTYTDDPAVAFVEINNENGLIHAWLGKQVDELPAIFSDVLAKQWNQWLLQRYATTDKLRVAWAEGERQAGGEAVSNGDFARQLDGWTLERNSGSQPTATMTLSDAAPETMPGVKSAQIQVTRPGTQNWHIRFQQAGMKVEADRSCTLSFWAKADKPATISVSIDQSHEPWHVLGGRTPVALTTQWQQHRVVLSITESDDNGRLIFDAPTQAATFWVTGISLQAGGALGLAPDERLEDASVAALRRTDASPRTVAAQREWIRFLWETEDRYWQAMYRYLKDDLKVRASIIGTAVGCSTPNLMARTDAVDSHAYWQHPEFPLRPWDQENWIVRNESMVNDRGGILSSLAMRRVLGKPFCVTEYGNAAPNTYVSEGHLLRAAYASFQDWDYTSASRYSHSNNWDLRRIRNYFDLDQHPTRMATLVPAAVMYLRGDVQPARQLVVATLGQEQELLGLRRSNAWQLVDAGTAGVRREVSLVHRVAIATEGSVVPQGALSPERADVTGDRFVADTNELDWDLRQQGRGIVTVNVPRSKAVIGFGGGKRFDLGGVIVEPGPTRQDGWSTITVTAMEGEFAKPPCRVLITATGDVENTRMGWKNAQKDSVGKNWGEAPSLVEGIAGRISLPVPSKAAAAWSLDERGQRKASLPVETSADGNAVIVLGPKWQTIWYEVELKP